MAAIYHIRMMVDYDVGLLAAVQLDAMLPLLQSNWEPRLPSWNPQGEGATKAQSVLDLLTPHALTQIATNSATE